MNSRIRSSPAATVVALVLGLGTFTYVRFIGYISFSELLVGSIGVIWLLFNTREWLRRPATGFAVLIALWLASAIATDILRGSPAALYLRGWARVGFLGVSGVLFFAFFRKDPWLVRPYLIGAAISGAVSLFVFKGGATEMKEAAGGLLDVTWRDMSWRDYYNYACNIFVVALAATTFRRFPRATSLVITGFGLANLVLGSRAAGGIQVMSGLTSLYLAQLLATAGSRSRILPGRWIAFLVGLAVIGSVSLMSAYEHAASHGWLGEEQKNRFELQSQSTLGVVFGGRVAFVAGVLALKDSPVVGYGSWAEDTGGYMARAMSLTGFVPDLSFMRQYQYRRIPTHSHILEGWVEHGLGGGIFWIAVVLFLSRFMMRCLFVVPGLAAVECLLLWSFLWNIPFSPIGNRVFIGASLGLMMAVWWMHKTAGSASRDRLQDRCRTLVATGRPGPEKRS